MDRYNYDHKNPSYDKRFVTKSTYNGLNLS